MSADRMNQIREWCKAKRVQGLKSHLPLVDDMEFLLAENERLEKRLPWPLRTRCVCDDCTGQGATAGERTPEKGIRVTVTDLETGEESVAEIMDNYLIITAGTCYLAHEQWYGNGTVQLTLKGGRNGASRMLPTEDGAADDVSR